MSECLGRDISVRQHSKVNIELPAISRHRRDMTERLLKATLNPNETNKQDLTDTCADSVDLDEMAHNKPSHQDLLCLPFCF